ncbi:FdhF/YdeP family oxidoreductase [Algivirga pacifica]|uniref:FdhF/YdeP family oxidoreductase n=1 Tax=Algivirga pacifica TaxID=1162670 RepID=A0ABP9D4J7_9BACT
MSEHHKKLKIKTPPHAAAGLKGVTAAVSMVNKAMGIPKAFKILSHLNQKDGIDCPGCAWPDPEKRSKLGEFCENGVKAIAEEAMDKKAGAPFFTQYSVDELLQKDDYWLGQQGRLTQPMVIRQGQTHYEPIAWEEAFELLGSSLNALPSPDDAIFYTSGRTSNEAAFLYQLFVRMFGTNNLPDCSNMCHESSGVALGHTLGIGKGSVLMEDFYKAEVILIMGQNPGTNHPRMLTALEKAKKHGAKIVTINPLKEVGLVQFKNPQSPSGMLGKGTHLTDLYLQIRINEDVALLKAIMIKLLEIAEDKPDVLDEHFIETQTIGFQALKEHLSHLDFNTLVERTGLSEKDVLELVRLLANHNKIIACWAMGLTQHVNAVDNIQEVVNLLLLKGSIGKEGAGTCPVRGHSNVQGDRTMGIHERPSKALLDKLASSFGFEPPREAGYNVVEAIEAMYKEKGKVFFALGGNFLPAAPDTHYTAEALRNCSLTVHVSTKLNRSHLVHGKVGLILPTLGRTDRHIQKSGEQFVTVENSMGIVHTSHGMIRPSSKDLMSEPEIVARMAAATLPNSNINWLYLIEDYSRIRELIEKTIAGFEGYNEKLNKNHGFELPNGARKGIFNTHNQKANFTINRTSSIELEQDEFLMMTIRSHDQFNTTIYGMDDRYRGIFNGRKVIFMHPEDMAAKGLKQEDRVTISSRYDGLIRKVEGFKVVSYDIPRGCVATYFPEANPLVPLHLHADRSHTPASKSVKVKIEL